MAGEPVEDPGNRVAREKASSWSSDRTDGRAVQEAPPDRISEGSENRIHLSVAFLSPACGSPARRR